jgi:hypothetical protein
MKSIKLMDILREYNNQGPSTPEVYILDIKNNKIIPSSLKEVQKISNLVYDMGGGETSYYDEYNIVIIDNLDLDDVVRGIKTGSKADKKLYIKYNLENTYSFPKADKIIVSQLVYHLDNIENFAKTVNDSLKPNGVIEFFSDEMLDQDVEFIKILIEDYNFNIPKGLTPNNIRRKKSQILKFQKNNTSSNTSQSFEVTFDKLYKMPQEEKVIYLKSRANEITQAYIGKGGRGNLDLSGYPITNLPDNLTKVGRDLDLENTKITSLPEDLTVGGSLYLRNTKITSLPKNLVVNGFLGLMNTPITSLPENLVVNDSLDLMNTPITSLPKNLTVEGNLDLRGTPISKLYTREQIKKMAPGIKGYIWL